MPTIQPLEIRSCTQCQGHFYLTPEFFRPLRGGETFHTWCRSCEAARARVRAAARRAGRAGGAVAGAMAWLYGRRFGVEIEFFGITRADAVRALSAVGISCRANRYDNSVGAGSWKIVSDGSVNGQGTGEGVGLELVSPPLQGEAGIEEAKNAFRALRDAGARVDRSCGLHVHYDMADMHLRGIKWFVRSWFNNQDKLSYFVSASRRQGAYCRQLDQYEVEAIERMRDARRPAGGRYRAVNVQAFPRHGTIEVRSHQGTLDARKFENWLKLGMAMLHTCKTARAPIAPQQGIGTFCEAIGLPAETGRYFRRRAQQFGVPSMVAEAPEEVAF